MLFKVGGTAECPWVSHSACGHKSPAIFSLCWFCSLLKVSARRAGEEELAVVRVGCAAHALARCPCFRGDRFSN